MMAAMTMPISPRVAVLSDIHGNLPALEAVLGEVEAAGADLIVLNGDMVDGPFPRETLDRLNALGDRALRLRGNGDRWLIEAIEGRFRHPDPATDELVRWSAQRITDAQRDLLRSLPLTRTLDLARSGRIAFCHATARSDNEILLVDSPLEHFDAALTTLDAATIVLGHTHMPFDRLANGRRIVNAGSVGMHYGHSGASWLLIDGDVTLRRTPYDIGAAASLIAQSGMPGAEDFVRDYVVTNPSDQEVMKIFHAAGDKQQATGSFD